jgi:hypothetical protein
MKYKSQELKPGQKVKFTIMAISSYGKPGELYTVASVDKTSRGDVCFRGENGSFMDPHRSLERSQYEIIE